MAMACGVVDCQEKPTGFAEVKHITNFSQPYDYKHLCIWVCEQHAKEIRR